MALSDPGPDLTPAEVKKIRERLTHSSRKLVGLESSLKAMKEKHELVLRELRLSSKAQREYASMEGGVISKIMDYILDIKEILEIMRTTFQEVYRNENTIADNLLEFEQTILRTNDRLFDQMERYRILGQLGELDTKILTLRFNGIAVDQTLSNRILKVRSSILTEKKIELDELQNESIGLFRDFAENIEKAIDDMAYKPETKELLQSMREVSWM